MNHNFHELFDQSMQVLKFLMFIFINSFYQPCEIISHPTAAGDDYQVLFFMETIPFANSDVGPKVVHPKYYKNYAYAVSHEVGFVFFFAYFDSKKFCPWKYEKKLSQM